MIRISGRSDLLAAALAAAVLVTLGSGPAAAQDMTAALADSGWDGKKVPLSQVCGRFGGKDTMSPKIVLSNIPEGVVAIEVWFNDESYEPMDWGGHGKVKYAIPAGSKSVELVGIPGETDALPEGVSVVKAHKGSQWSGTGGAYLPPCSGGRGNSYSAWVIAKSADGDRIGPRLKVPFGGY